MKRVNTRVGFCIILAMSAALLSVAVLAQGAAKELVRVVGSDSMAHTITLYANEYSGANPNCNVLVSGGSVGNGWSRLLDGTAEIAMLSYFPTKAQQEEAKAKGVSLKEAIVGWGGIVLITNPANPVESLTLDQVRNVLTGKVVNWKDVGGPDKPIQIFTVSEEARVGTDRFIKEEFLKSPFAPSAKNLSYFRSIPPTVAETEGAIGVIRMRNLERLIEQGQDAKIKVLGIKKDDRAPAVTPSRESIDEGTYPITRPFLLYTLAGQGSKSAADFFNFCEARNPRPRGAGLASTGRK